MLLTEIYRSLCDKDERVNERNKKNEGWDWS